MSTTATTPDTFAFDVDRAEALRRRMRSSVLVTAYNLAKMPLAWWSGLRIDELEPERCRVSVPYRWRTTNPFGCTHFAALAMAGELSTGALVMAALEGAPGRGSMIMNRAEVTYTRRATGRSTFTCTEGHLLDAAVRAAVTSGEWTEVTLSTAGQDAAGEPLSSMHFTWAVRVRPRGDR